MKKYNGSIKGQAMAEFVVLFPILIFFFYGVLQFSVIAIKAQKLQMAAYYASRLYSKHCIRGVKVGTVIQLESKKSDILNDVTFNVKQYLGESNVQVTLEGDDKIVLIWPVFVHFFGYFKEISLKASGAMENEPLSYGGGRYYDPTEQLQ